MNCLHVYLTLRGRIKDTVETVHIKLSYVCYYLHGNTAVIALHSTTVATLLHVSSYYTGVFSSVSLGRKAVTVVECVQFQEEYTYCKSGQQYYITGNFLDRARRETIPGFLCLL